MGTISIGGFPIPAYLLAFLVAYLYVDWKSKKLNSTKQIDLLLWTYVGAWKLSYIIFYYDAFIQAPFSMLYFDGGLKGHIIGLILVGTLYFLKQPYFHLTIVFAQWIRFITLYEAVLASSIGDWLFACLWVLLLILFEWKKWQWLVFIPLVVLLIQHTLLAPFVWIHIILIVMQIVKQKRTQWVGLTILSILLGLFLNEIELHTKQLAAGDRHIQLKTVEGQTYDTREQEDEIIVVNFFATWCPPCKAEMPHLQSFADQLPDQTQLIGVNLTKRDDGIDVLKRFMDNYHVTYPILLDQDDRYGKQYRVVSIPTTVLLKNGNEIHRIVGPVSEEGLRKLIMQYTR